MDNMIITDEDVAALESEYRDELRFNEYRKSALKNYEDVQACAGSGKTTLVAAKLILLAKKWTEVYKGICVLTHTNIAKDEILERLQLHPSGYKILSYPHFVGTIQEFVNKYLGLPYLRTMYGFKRFSENNEANTEVYRIKQTGFPMNNLCKNLYRAVGKLDYPEIERALGSIQYINAAFDIVFFYGPYNAQLLSRAGDSSRYKLLSELKEKLNVSGIFQFRDMYAFAKKLLEINPYVGESLRKRFPFVFIDEMQDTQKFQDDLIKMIFDGDDVVMQRFGDPDQAIFNGIGGEKPNESYNNAELVTIADSHRFGNDIAHKIRGLSYNQLSLGSIRDNLDGDGPHTIFLYNDQNIECVLDKFGEVVKNYLSTSTQLTEKQREDFVVKAVGGVGRENPNSLTIKHYWQEYDKAKAAKSFRADKLIHVVKKCTRNVDDNVSDDYKLLIQGILDLLRKANKKTTNTEGKEVYFTTTSLIQHLQAIRKYKDFRRLLTVWITKSLPNQEMWDSQITSLKDLLGLSGQYLTQEALDFLVYDNADVPEQEEEANATTNIYRCQNGLEVEVATIHSVKGETHDATLVLETKFNGYFDIKELLAFLVNYETTRPVEDLEHPTTKASIRASFLKRLYVATSRPRHLLCLAIHIDHITDEQIKALEETKNWCIEKL